MGKYYALAKNMVNSIDSICDSIQTLSSSFNLYIDKIPKVNNKYDIFARNVYENLSSLNERINSIREELESVKKFVLNDGKKIDDQEEEMLRRKLEELQIKKRNNNDIKMFLQ